MDGRTPRIPLRASPTAVLMTVSFIHWLGYATWQALSNNFALIRGRPKE